MITPAFNLTATERVLPKLALDFTTASLDPRVTFTRTTGAINPATYTNSDGYVVAATDNQPRFDYDPIALTCKGLLIEESRSNLLTYSQTFDNSTAWYSGINASWVPAAAVSPSGSTDAYLLKENALNGAHSTYYKVSLGTVTGTYTGTLYAKSNGRRYLVLSISGSANRTWFDLQTGAVSTLGTGVTASISPAGDGWYRCTVTQTLSATGLNFEPLIANTSSSIVYTGNNSSGLYLWGAQLEAGAFATSYIPTTLLPLTRNADVATMTGTDFSDWFNASEGTFVAYINTGTNPNQTDASGVARGALCVNDGTTNNRLRVGVSITGFIVASGGSTVASITNIGSVSKNTDYKFSCGYKTNYFQVAKNTTLGIADTSGAVPSGLTTVELGRSSSGGVGNLCGYIQKVMYYPYELSNAQLQATSK